MSGAGLAFSEEDDVEMEDLFMEFVEEASLGVGFVFDWLVFSGVSSFAIEGTVLIGGWTGGALAGTAIVSANNASIACTDDTKWITRLIFPFTLLKMVFFSNGKSILLREFGSVSFGDIMIRLSSSGKLRRPTKSFFV